MISVLEGYCETPGMLSIIITYSTLFSTTFKKYFRGTPSYSNYRLILTSSFAQTDSSDWKPHSLFQH